MSQDVEAKFESIAERALQEAARVEASVAQYQDGLKTFIEMAKTALQASEEMDAAEEDS